MVPMVPMVPVLYRQDYHAKLAAQKIQKTWRNFRLYTDGYSPTHSNGDIHGVFSQTHTKHRAATKIQAIVRAHTVRQSIPMHNMVHWIIHNILA